VQIAALWALRNFGLLDMYRSRMAGMGVVSLCMRVLDDSSAPPGVQHAAVCLLQMLSTADMQNVKLISEHQALPRLVSFLYGKHRYVPLLHVSPQQLTPTICGLSGLFLGHENQQQM
jgi:hypothetical protein